MDEPNNAFSPNDRNRSQWPVRCEPLLSRIDPLLTGAIRQPDTACEIQCSNSVGKLTLPFPFFTRLSAQGGLSLHSKQLFLAELQSYGVAWLGEQSQNGSNRIAPLHLDEPIDVHQLQNAQAIELQMFGLPFQTLPNARRGRWTPGLPIEISNFEQLGKKVELLRVLSGGMSPIGVAMVAGSVYEDVRFMIDSGIDFITILCDVQYGLLPSNALGFAPLEPALEQSVKAVQDSGSRIKLLVSSSLYDGHQMHRCLQLGASAVSIDAFLSRSKPKEVAPAKETFGSVLSSYVPAAAGSSFAWVGPALKQLIEELQDSATYAGQATTPRP
jgi:hypothetical protein